MLQRFGRLRRSKSIAQLRHSGQMQLFPCRRISLPLRRLSANRDSPSDRFGQGIGPSESRVHRWHENPFAGEIQPAPRARRAKGVFSVLGKPGSRHGYPYRNQRLPSVPLRLEPGDLIGLRRGRVSFWSSRCPGPKGLKWFASRGFGARIFAIAPAKDASPP